ncbi:hypothetical protein [Peribacillus frigoritolerans]|uniref:hypothetical protein n=1 Tax=Peribacillus frigoritolerans TaxID=450367 RepID=UPI0032E3B43A
MKTRPPSFAKTGNSKATDSLNYKIACCFAFYKVWPAYVNSPTFAEKHLENDFNISISYENTKGLKL